MTRRLIPLVLIAVLTAGCLYTYKLELPETRTYPAAGIGSVSVITKNGGIAVSATADTLITADITRRCYGRDKADAEGAIDNIVITDTVVETELQFEADMPGGSRNYGAEFEVQASDSTWLHLTTSNGDIALTSMIAGAAASTSNGDMSLLDTRGQMVLNTSDGNVTVQVHYGGITIETSNGIIDCDLAELGATESAILETSNGNVTLSLPDDVSAEFDASTSNGDVTIVGFPSGSVKYDTSERTHKAGTIGSGASTIEVSTSNGNVIIRAR